MGLLHWIQAGVEMPAKHNFLRSMGFYKTRGGYWETDYSKARMPERDIRRWTLKELKSYYSNYMF